MNQQAEIDYFLKYYASIYEQNPNVEITGDSIYNALKVYGMSDEQYQNRDMIREMYNLEDSFKTSPNLNVYFDDRQPGFLQFRSKSAQQDSKCAKIYFTTSKENIELAANEIFSFIDKNDISTFSKIAVSARSDSIVVRVPNIGDVEKVVNFIKNNKTLQAIAGKTNPFIHREGNMAIGYDDLLSYNTVVSNLVKDYLQDLKNKNTLSTASLEGFVNFTKNYYNDTFRNCSSITNIENDEHFKELGGIDRFGSMGYAINNFEQVTKLIIETCSGNMDLEKYNDYYYNCRLVKKNDEFINYYEETFKRKKDRFGRDNTLNINDCINLFNEYISIAYSKYGNNIYAYLNSYLEGNINAITRDNNLRERFSNMLNPNLLKQITNGNIYGYVGAVINNIKNNSIQNSLEPGYTIFYNASVDTFIKYGYEQLNTAINQGKKGDYRFFTDGNNQNRTNLANYVNPSMIDMYCKYYLVSLGINKDELNNINVSSEFAAQIARTISMQKQNQM